MTALKRPAWWAVLILLVMFALAVHSMVQKSPTFDEQGFITRGLAYLRGENRHIRVGHPLGLNALSALFLVKDGAVKLPIDDPSFEQTSFHRPSELFLWEIGNNVEHVMFLARLPTVYLALLLAAVTGRWALEMSQRPWSGVLALLLIAFDPNLLAHARLATTDLGLTVAAALAGFTLWRHLRRPSWTKAVVAGICFGLLQNTKFTAGLFVPLLAVVIALTFVWYWLAQPGGRRAILYSFVFPLVTAFPLAAFLTLWAAYGFDLGTLPVDLPAFSQLSGRTLPLAHHLEQLTDLGGRLEHSTPSFLLGRYSDRGWWYYFPVAFLLKTPMPYLILLVWSLISVAVDSFRRFGRPRSLDASSGRLIDLAALLIPAFGYGAIALTSEINLGYRHLLPILPFLSVFVAVVLGRQTSFVTGQRMRSPALRSALVGVLVVLLAVSTVIVSPHFLAYFNLLAGGPDGGWRALVDSNLDWGQDLAGLKAWVDENNVDNVWLSYFGEARPEYYGISYTGLDSFPPRLMNPNARPFYPPVPAPGVYAISATTLQGVHFENHDLFAWFRERVPETKIGHSIFIYKVPEDDGVTALALSGVQLDEIQQEDFAEFGSNNVVPRWFDARQSMLVVSDPNSWLVLGKDVQPHPAVSGAIHKAYEEPIEGAGTLLHKAKPDQLPSLISDFVPTSNRVDEKLRLKDGRILFLGHAIAAGRPGRGEILELVTAAAQNSDPTPVKMFVHMTNSDGEIVSQWDGLGAAWEGWLQGDQLIQFHDLPIPTDLPAGRYELWAGFYDPDTLERWRSSTADRVFLKAVTIL